MKRNPAPLRICHAPGGALRGKHTAQVESAQHGDFTLRLLFLRCAADQNCVHRILLPNNIYSPAIAVPAIGACGPSACGGPGSYGCTVDTFTDASQATLWGPTDIEIVYTDTSNYLTLQAYITDSGNGCVRKFTRNNFWLTTYEPMVFGACGANRNLSTVIPTYLAADATNIAANSVPALYVAFTEMNQIRWHDPSAAMYTATFDAKDKAGRCGGQLLR